MRKFTIAIALLLVVAIAAPAVQGETFPDVDEEHWAYDAVEALVAAGIVEGYPDGEYKGDQTITRYEMAMMVNRAVENINQELDWLEDDLGYLQDQVDELEDGLTAAQAEDVVAIVERMMEEEIGPQDELSEGQAEQVTEIVEAMVAEFEDELEMMDAELGALRYVIETQTDALWAETEDIHDSIADVNDEIEALREEMEEEDPLQFRGTYAVDFDHVNVVDGADDFVDVYEFDYWYVDEFPSQLTIEGTVENFDSATDYAQYVRDEIDAGTFDDVEDFNDAVPAEYEIAEESTTTTYKYDWEGEEVVEAPAQTTGFSHTFGFGVDITTEFFDASLDFEVDDDEFDLSDTVFEAEGETWSGSFTPSNAVSQRDFSFDSETIKGVTFDYHPWNVDTFFGEMTVDSTVADDETSFYEEGNEWEFEEITTDVDGYVLGTMLSREFAGVELGASYAMEAVDQFDVLAEENTGIIGFDAATSVANVDLSGDFGYSYPYDEDEDGGILARGDAEVSLEGLADLSADVRFRDENFAPLYGADATFDAADVGFDRFDDGIGEDALGFGVRAEQDLVDFLTEGYAEFNMYNYQLSQDDSYNDWNALVGGGAELLVDGLEGSASFERRYDDATEVNLDRIEGGATYERGALDVAAGTEMLMSDVDNTENWLLVDGDASFEVIDNVTLTGHGEFEQNVAYTEDQEKILFGGGVEVSDMNLIGNFDFNANASFDMQTINLPADDGDTTVIGVGGGVVYEKGALTLNNDVSFTNKEGDYLLAERTEDWYDGYYDGFAEALYDGNEIENVFGLEYEIIEDTDFTIDWTETLFDATEDNYEDIDWHTRKIEAGVSISF